MTRQAIVLHVTLLTAVYPLGQLGFAPRGPDFDTRWQPPRGHRTGAQNAANSLGQASGPLVGGALFVWQMNAASLLSGGLLMALALVIAWTSTGRTTMRTQT